ncbi:E3 ubiquitin-protein ligase WAV3-like [Andrographis paniculata]|uniref:E3 ubiquitin-protein ligase WAV3-like n=1 Tax=Andrographis paniculata TaxID=175694 RepID=UPI0021E924B3|nr:E3 ubiquitin-protein ligase WAV3-like [Andrographis paniculata]
MGTGWRRAFCNTVSRERGDSAAAEKQQGGNLRFKLAGGSVPSTPRLRCRTNASGDGGENVDVVSPDFERRTTPKSQNKSPRSRLGGSNPSSPRSPFAILKNTLRLSRNSCGVCMQSVKTGQGMAIYTAECSHAFHFPCIASHVRKQRSLICPVCNTNWKDVPLLAIHTQNRSKNPQPEEEKLIVVDSGTPSKSTPVSSPKLTKLCDSKSYADDEPLVTPKSGAKFVPIPEAARDEEDEEEVEEFQGFFVNPISSSDSSFSNHRSSRDVEVSLLHEAAVISQGRTHGTYVVVLKVKAPAPPPPHARDAARRAPIDLVTVLDVSGSMTGVKLEMLKRAMRLVISSLGAADRLSIVAFAAATTRLLPLRRMTTNGQRLARRIIDRLSCSQGSSMAEALKQATKVLEERRERNPVASIILLSDGQNDAVPPNNRTGTAQRTTTGPSHVSSTRFSHVEIPVHTSGFGRDPAEDAFSKCVGGLLSVVVQDLRVQIGFGPGSDPAEITAVYTYNERPEVLGSGCARLGDLYAEEEKELLLEIRVPNTRVGSHHVLSVRCCYKDPATQEPIYGQNQALLVPSPQTVRSGLPRIERLRNAFVTVRAVAESRRLIEHNELSSAMQLLASARALLLQWKSAAAAECVKGLEAEMREVLWRRQYEQEVAARRRAPAEEREVGVLVDENGEPLTPTSAWRAAEKLAKVAQMKKSMNRVSDLHGFENARF